MARDGHWRRPQLVIHVDWGRERRKQIAVEAEWTGKYYEIVRMDEFLGMVTYWMLGDPWEPLTSEGVS